MKRIKILTSVALSCMLFTGCQDLDTLPQGNTITTGQKEEVADLNPARAEAGVNGIFAQMNQFAPNASALGSERHNDIGYPSIMLFTEANGWDMVAYANGYNWMSGGLSYTDRVWTSNEGQIVWNDLYAYIYAANNVAGLMSPDTENSTQQFYLGQALAMRAFSYFHLAQLYQFNYVGNQDKPCVPIITDKNKDEAAAGVARSTVGEVYAQIYEDIDNAVRLLDAAEASGLTRADKRYVSAAVAYGIRARINMTTQKWADALSDANNAIAKSGATPASIAEVSVPTFWSANQANCMWAIIVAETDRVVTTGICNWPSHMGSLNYGYANYSKGRLINKSLFSTIQTSDARKGWWLDENVTSPNIDEAQAAYVKEKSYGAYVQVKFAPYNNVVASSTNANDIFLMRVEEMYLIKAEAEAMGGATATGVATLESLIKTYRDPEYTCTASSATDVQEEIFRQRRIELWGEGLIWYDIMRLNKGVDRRGCGFPDASRIFNIPAGDNILLWRIPEAECQANAALRGLDQPTTIPTPVSDVE